MCYLGLKKKEKGTTKWWNPTKIRSIHCIEPAEFAKKKWGFDCSMGFDSNGLMSYPSIYTAEPKPTQSVSSFGKIPCNLTIIQHSPWHLHECPVSIPFMSHQHPLRSIGIQSPLLLCGRKNITGPDPKVFSEHGEASTVATPFFFTNVNPVDMLKIRPRKYCNAIMLSTRW